jgi:hypothetical protein
MKLEFLTGYLNENQRSTDSLKIYYDFSGMSGFFVPNRIYGGETQFNSVPGGFSINKNYYPGIFISCYKESGLFTGSGIFEGTNNLKVLNELSGDNLSLFYNFGALNCNKSFNIASKQIVIPTGKIQVLSYIESKNSNNNPFEIILGLNDAYKLTLEFSGTINGSKQENYKSTNLGELSFQNISSLRLNDKIIEHTYFDFIEDEIFNTKINLTGSYFNQEKNIHIGNIPTGKYRNGYTGFIGHLDDFIAIQEYFDLNLSAGLSKIFTKTGEATEIINLTGVKYNVIRSGFLNPTGILGTGITGYRMVPSEEVIDSSCGTSCVVYVQSGITGLITGEKIEYVIAGQEQYTVFQQNIKYDLHDQDYASNFTKNYIIFDLKLDQEDIFNIQLYKDVDNKFEIPDYSLLNENYLTQDVITDKELLIFFNGINTSSGDYQIIGNNKFKIISVDKDFDDDVIYSLSSLSNAESYLFNNVNPLVDGHVSLGEINNNKKYNVFLNGQKLISGLDYRITGIGIDYLALIGNQLASGQVYAIEDNFLTGVTGANLKLYNPLIKYNNERIWVNGVLQNKNENYILTSCINNMLLATGDIEIKKEIIFQNEYNRFI